MCHSTLPEGYIYKDKIDLQHNKKQFWLVQGIGIILLLGLLVAGYFIVDFTKIEPNTEMYIAIAVGLVGYILYIIVHEITHAIVMRLSVKSKLNFGFNGWAAYAGSTGYYDKVHYIIIALSPLVIWGIILGVLNVFFHSGVWFWVIWFIQAGNISGAAGDLFCTYKMFTYPKDILVCDTGLDMTVYCRNEETVND
ncbi:MAG: DUF3267 domain-containing protein [Clostridia bacterium]|nr:DUF3267 domain-containing protein [Clostridia bacterium]